MEKKRIDFIDLAKGVCILMVILNHGGIWPDIPGTQTLRMPLYFTLSGLFYKDYGGWLQLAAKKTNKLLLPFLFFYLVGYAVFYAGQAWMPQLMQTKASGVLDIFTQKELFNGPIWFLCCLFWANMYFYVLRTLCKKEWVLALATLAASGVGVYLGNNFMVPCDMDTALTSLPFFYLGYALRRTPLLYPHRLDRYAVPAAVALFAIGALISVAASHPYIDFSFNQLHGNLGFLYIISFCMVLSVLLLCKAVGRLPFLSYFGRYSIIPLCMQELWLRPVKFVVNRLGVGDLQPYLITLLIILLCWASIPVLKRWLPWFTAQKDLIPTPKPAEKAVA